MIIGNFICDPASGIYSGSIRTLLVERTDIELRPVDRAGEREPHYRIVQEGEDGAVELGAAWSRQGEKGREYLSVILDDPSLPHSLNAALFAEQDGTATLVWTSRSEAAKPAPARLQRRRDGVAQQSKPLASDSNNLIVFARHRHPQGPIVSSGGSAIARDDAAACFRCRRTDRSPWRHPSDDTAWQESSTMAKAAQSMRAAEEKYSALMNALQKNMRWQSLAICSQCSLM